MGAICCIDGDAGCLQNLRQFRRVLLALLLGLGLVYPMAASACLGAMLGLCLDTCSTCILAVQVAL